MDKEKGKLEQMSDEVLIKESLNGRSEAFGRLVQRYHTRVYGYVYDKVKEHNMAEEIVQETFVKAYTALHQCRQPQAFSHWLLSIAQNNCRMWFRKVKKDQTVDLDSVVASAVSESNLERLATVESLIGTLAKDYQIILKMKYYDGMSCEQIAKRLRKPMGTVMSQLSRCYEIIREKLSKYYGEYQ